MQRCRYEMPYLGLPLHRVDGAFTCASDSGCLEPSCMLLSRSRFDCDSVEVPSIPDFTRELAILRCSTERG